MYRYIISLFLRPFWEGEKAVRERKVPPKGGKKGPERGKVIA